ncbi:phosphoribulokinase/uridine kinase [Bisporella sp. PMI_857]|nr:phosphoribulokinase/uridine kinase [Bisporella sp. PMI_857]
MEQEIERLVTKVWTKFQTIPQDKRFLVAVSGIPGSGKTTLAASVTHRLNDTYAASNGQMTLPSIAGFVPMDGYHFSRAHLSSMPDPENAHARRGAEFTFDGLSFLALVRAIRQPLSPASPVIFAPSFDHALKDPKADDISILPTTRILVFEGNYLSLDKEPWREAAGLMDELWFVDVDFELARQRLVPRHVKAGIARNEKEAEKRIRENDLVNGQEIVSGRMEVHEFIITNGTVV